MLSAFVNSGYETLKDPFLRASYLLELNGWKMRDVLIRRADFLEMILDKQQVLSSNDATFEEKNQILEECSRELNRLQQSFAKAFENERYAECMDVLVEWKYWRSLQSIADRWAAQGKGIE